MMVYQGGCPLDTAGREINKKKKKTWWEVKIIS
jgi:hypothetical protein